LIGRYDVDGVREVVAQLEAMQKVADHRHPLFRHDGVACFNYLYVEITKHVLRCVENVALKKSDPQFEDLEFMAALDVAFANRYLAAMGVGETPPFQPRCWQALLDHRDTRDISPLIFAVAGVNAHVNFDLPFALVKACEMMTRELDAGSNRADYLLINNIFDHHMAHLRRHFESRFLKNFDTARVAKVENKIGDVVVVVARNLAWCTAVRLWAVHEDEKTMLRRARTRDRLVAWSNNGLFQLDRVPALAFRALHLVPARPAKAVARRGLDRTGWVSPKPTAPTPEPLEPSSDAPPPVPAPES
jgi:hypothetical protein